jgi:chromosome segregation ATPase
MLKKTSAGLLRFPLAIVLFGAFGIGWGIGAWGQEPVADLQAAESPGADSAPTAGKLTESVREARSQIDRMDSQMAALEDEEKSLMAQLREGQRGQFDVRQQIVKGDEKLQELARKIETLQGELNVLKEAFAQRMTEHPEYAAQHARQTAAIERSGAIQRETMALANDRVRVQLELQALEKQLVEMTDETVPEPAAAGTTLSAEDPDQL